MTDDPLREVMGYTTPPSYRASGWAMAIGGAWMFLWIIVGAINEWPFWLVYLLGFPGSATAFVGWMFWNHRAESERDLYRYRGKP